MSSNLNAQKPVPGRPVMVTVKISELIKWYKEGKLVDYKKNRGTLSTSKKLIVNSDPLKDMKINGFSAVGFGTLSISDEENGTFKIADGHSRLRASIEFLEFVGEKHIETNTEIDPKVSVQIVHKTDHLKTYKYLNSSKIHNGRAKINNTDLVLGNLLNKTLNLYGITIDPKLWQPVVTILMALHTKCENKAVNTLTLNDIKQAQAAVKPLKNMLASEKKIKVSDVTQERLADALIYWQELQEIAIKLATNGSKSASDIAKSLKKSGACNYLLLDYLGERKVASQSAKTVVDKMIKNYVEVCHEFGTVSQFNGTKTRRAIDELDSLLQKPIKI